MAKSLLFRKGCHFGLSKREGRGLKVLAFRIELLVVVATAFIGNGIGSSWLLVERFLLGLLDVEERIVYGGVVQIYFIGFALGGQQLPHPSH